MRQAGFRYDSRSRTAYFEITVPKTGGRVRRRKRVPRVRDRAQALELYGEFRRSVLEPGSPKRDQTLQEYVEKNWPISRDARRPISAETAEREMNALESRILPALGHLPLNKITDVNIEDFAAQLLTTKLSNATVNSRLRY